MRKKICILSAAVLCLCCITACGETAEPILSPAAEKDSAIQITQKIYAKDYPSEDGKVILGSYSYEAPVMTGVSDDASSETVVDAFNGAMTDWVEEKAEAWDEAMENAQAWYDESRKDEWEYYGQWTDETYCQMNTTEVMISLRFAHYVYSGGAHGYTYYTSMLFDMEKGVFTDVLALSDDPEGLKAAVTEDILQQIEEKELVVQFGYWNDYADYVAQWSEDHSVFFNETGDMEIIFPAYELASYAAGEQWFSVDRSVWEPYLNEEGAALLRVE